MDRGELTGLALVPWVGRVREHQMRLYKPAKEREGRNVARGNPYVEFSGEVLLPPHLTKHSTLPYFHINLHKPHPGFLKGERPQAAARPPCRYSPGSDSLRAEGRCSFRP
jgi:hypothetical protein